MYRAIVLMEKLRFSRSVDNPRSHAVREPQGDPSQFLRPLTGLAAADAEVGDAARRPPWGYSTDTASHRTRGRPDASRKQESRAGSPWEHRRRPRDRRRRPCDREALAKALVHSHARRTYTHGSASSSEARAAGHMWRVTGAGRGAGKTRGSRAGGRSSEVT